MEFIEEDIEAASYFANGGGENVIFDTYSTPFLFSTENLEEISKFVSYENKDVLTIASSGDQYLSSIYNGASNVDIYDINRFTCYITYLKVAAILTLTYEEFLAFFVPAADFVNEDFWNLRLLKKVLPALPSDVGNFWERIIFQCKKSGYGNFVCPNSFFSKRENMMTGMPFYYNEKDYYKMQNILRSRINKFPNFIETDLLKIGENVKATYDVIYLSNVVENIVRGEIEGYYGYVPRYLEDEIERDIVSEVLEQVIQLTRKKSKTLCILSYRPNTDLEISSDWLYNNNLFEVNKISSKYYSDERPNSDLVLTYSLSRKDKINIRR